MTISEAIDLQRKTNSKKLYTVHIRITSYNVCYTKLLRVDGFEVVVGHEAMEVLESIGELGAADNKCFVAK